MSKSPKKGRDLALTIKELLESPRMKLAVAAFAKNKTMMKALLTELGMEAESVAKYAVIRAYAANKELTSREILAILRRVGVINSDDRDPEDVLKGMPKKDFNEMNTYNIYFGMSKEEAKLYLDEINPTLSESDKNKLLDQVKNHFSIS